MTVEGPLKDIFEREKMEKDAERYNEVSKLLTWRDEDVEWNYNGFKPLKETDVGLWQYSVIEGKWLKYV